MNIESSSLDGQILLLLKIGQLPLEQVVELTDADRSVTLSVISRLIADGHLELVIIQYPWGIEFEVQRTAKSAEAIRLGSRAEAELGVRWNHQYRRDEVGCLREQCLNGSDARNAANL